jgi:hypothetical protein
MSPFRALVEVALSPFKSSPIDTKSGYLCHSGTQYLGVGWWVLPRKLR